ncbi:Tetraspanin-1 [Channa argus]|uniref:Tetraspanin-1 n=1 Tax=Channa argus TaxID=215402 RepID=A0A6G1PK13_CHAAH|nr:Tetraspanin-1 [Channa argus]
MVGTRRTKRRTKRRRLSTDGECEPIKISVAPSPLLSAVIKKHLPNHFFFTCLSRGARQRRAHSSTQENSNHQLCGMTLMAVGTVVGVNRSSLLQLLGPFSSQSVQFINVGFFCIAIGALLLVLLGLLGFCGAHKESRCLLLTLRCCGFTNYTDFVGSTFEKENGGVLPSSCCRTNSTTCSRDDAALSGVQGCCKLILQIIKDHGNIMGSVAAGIGLLE